MAGRGRRRGWSLPPFKDNGRLRSALLVIRPIDAS